MSTTSSPDQMVQVVMQQIASRNSAAAAAAASASAAASTPLAILGKPEIKPTSLVVYGSTGRRLNFSPEELQEPPESLKDNEKALKEWKKLVPVYVRKALNVTHFQSMSVPELRGVMERAVARSLHREQEARRKKTQKRSQQKMQKSECVMLRNVVGRGGLDDELKDEVIAEVMRYGEVVSATAHECPDTTLKDEEAVRIFIRFENKEAAARAQKDLHLRVFDGRYLAACFFPLERFLTRDLAPKNGEPKLPQQCYSRFSGESDALEGVTEEKQQALSKLPKVGPPPLPPHAQALVEVLQLAAEGKDVSDDLLAAADPVTISQRKIAAEQETDRKRKAEEMEETRAAKIKAAAEFASKLNANHVEKQRKKEQNKTTEDMDGID